MKPRRDNPLPLTTTRYGGTSAKSDREPGFAIHVAWRQRLPSSPHFSSVRIATKRTPPLARAEDGEVNYGVRRPVCRLAATATLLRRLGRRQRHPIPLASRAGLAILDDMARSVRRGRAAATPYRVEVTARHGRPAPWGWQVFRRGETRPIEQSVSGYATETDAWTAGGSAVTRFERADR
jgi:hypothetical protein